MAETDAAERARMVRARASINNRRDRQLARVAWEANQPGPLPFDWEAWRRNRAGWAGLHVQCLGRGRCVAGRRGDDVGDVG